MPEAQVILHLLEFGDYVLAHSQPLGLGQFQPIAEPFSGDAQGVWRELLAASLLQA